MNLEKVYCAECQGFFPQDKISRSGLCPGCSKDLVRLFSLKPEVATERIHEKQENEGNIPCFNTGKKKNCGQFNCEWQDICDRN
ncbi:MAG: hypothetical protein PHQ42_05125 [Patescibacteria group bacterium]|nr:hypothetical protein [Patescibacteria group bacterium]